MGINEILSTSNLKHTKPHSFSETQIIGSLVALFIPEMVFKREHEHVSKISKEG